MYKIHTHRMICSSVDYTKEEVRHICVFHDIDNQNLLAKIYTYTFLCSTIEFLDQLSNHYIYGVHITYNLPCVYNPPKHNNFGIFQGC
jgi:hypothetical protein